MSLPHTPCGALGTAFSQGEETEEDGSLNKAEWPKPLGSWSPQPGERTGSVEGRQAFTRKENLETDFEEEKKIE